MNNTSPEVSSLGFKEKLKVWSSKDSLNPIIIGNKNFSLRLQSFFVSSPMLVHFDHTAIFDVYSEKNLLIIIGPLSQVQVDKIKRIKKDLVHDFKVIYLEMLFEEKKGIGKYQKEICEKIDYQVDHFLIEEFVSLDNIAQLLREIA